MRIVSGVRSPTLKFPSLMKAKSSAFAMHTMPASAMSTSIPLQRKRNKSRTFFSIIHIHSSIRLHLPKTRVYREHHHAREEQYPHDARVWAPREVGQEEQQQCVRECARCDGRSVLELS